MSLKADTPIDDSNLKTTSAKTVTWLHLSDLHACKPKTGWDAKRVTDTLCKDLRKMQEKKGLRPDLIFFTGDAAYGHLGNGEGKSITEQFREAHDFFTAVRESFDPPIDQRNLFLVPGNHDVNRNRITDFETEWLLSGDRTLDEITRCIQTTGVNWKQLLGRLDDYAHFLQTYGYDHLLTGRDRLIYADAREVNGLRVGIAGFNSAWSSRGVGRDEMGRLWMAGRFQLDTLNQEMPPNDFKIALLHHPCNWLFSEENPTFGRQLERDFPFVLHGHEHQDFVRNNASNGHTVISTGACHEWSESKNNGYNFVRLDFTAERGDVWLRQYDSTGGGWIPRIVHDCTNDQGCWPLEHLKPWIEMVSNKINPVVKNATTNIIAEITAIDEDQTKDYEPRYRKAVADKLDYIELFGIDLPKEAKEYSLTVAYVSLNLADEDQEDSEDEELDDEITGVEQTSFPAEQVFDNLSDPANKGRLLIRGVAGSGKTTLLRWAAVQSARNEAIKQEQTSIGSIDKEFHGEVDKRIFNSDRDWRHKIPFIIRLRDYANGQLPRPNEFPLLLAKELPDSPEGWIDTVLSNGRGLIMLDGVDEIPKHTRNTTMREIRNLINTYPNNYYVVTTRPEAVEKLEFIELGFLSARVEPMAVVERNEFIDKWHEAMETRLRNWNEPADLRPLAKRLKNRLEATPSVARLTSNPLLCAVVCALHRGRNENLPETPVELCEKLCEMLLDRRDKERPCIESQKWIDEAYGQVDFRVRKGLLSQLAYHMVNSGVSEITETDADEQIMEALKSYQLTGNIHAKAVRRALVERSGMLQESSEHKIEFLHNTLKEFLAAEHFLNVGDYQILADHTDEASWQPVILFAVALPRDGSRFATDLVRAILQKISLDTPPKGQSKEAKLEVSKVKSQQFFLFRCYANAYQINGSDIKQAFSILSKQLLPPQNMTDALALASCGEAIVPYLKNRRGLKASERAACVRTLGLIGNKQATILLKDYLSDTTLSVAKELAKLDNDWSQISAITKYIERNGTIPIQIPRGFQDLSSLTIFPNLTSLNLAGTQVSDISILENFPNLTSLNLAGTQVSDISVLKNFPNLTSLNLAGTQVSDISVLKNLLDLTDLNLGRTQVNDISILAILNGLTYLNLAGTQVSDISVLRNLKILTSLSISETYVSSISTLVNLKNLTSLNLGGKQLNEISILNVLHYLTSLSITGKQVSDISAIAALQNLTHLSLWGTQVSDISAIAALQNLTHLNLWGAQVSDISAIAALQNLTHLNLSGTQVSDISAIAALQNLTHLDLSGTQVSDISALTMLTNFRYLDIRFTKVSDISALATIDDINIQK
jgi:Leucine-rich repeat (LRR) protein/3',5'-cyclic AMP phosphodiesterase CpdA